MKIDLLLADAASVSEGKLNALGIGWAMILPGAPFSVCGVVHVPWDQARETHTLFLELLDGDGEPFALPDNTEPFTVTFEQERSLRETVNAGVKPGTSLTWPFCATFGGLPLAPEMLYEWRASIDGHHEEHWTLPFRTVALPPELREAA
jgi:Family of unknown function (DUF6941)